MVSFSSYSAAGVVHTLERRLCHSGWSILFVTGGLNGYTTLDFTQPGGLLVFSAFESRHPTARQSGEAFVGLTVRVAAPGTTEQRVSEVRTRHGACLVRGCVRSNQACRHEVFSRMGSQFERLYGAT